MTAVSEIKKVHVPLGDDAYNIYIGTCILADVELVKPYITSKQICLVTNQVIADLYLPTITDTLTRIDADIQLQVVILPEGEQHKNQSALDSIYNCLIENKFSRDCLLIALGGGIVGDITGFAAASYQRGAAFIQIPTTLLSQVDSSVGGKTGINHRLGKNLIGAFYQPKAVLIDINVLKTLPKREIAAGMAEVIKYGLIRDIDFLHHLDNIMEDVMALSPDVVAEVIQTSCQHKADVVMADEKEHGERATLNLGHTFGHAIESLTHYQTYLHGEAVAIGTMMALELSRLHTWLSAADIDLAERLFKRADCPVNLADCPIKLSPQDIRAAMQRDKKVRAGQLKLILLKALGEAVIDSDSSEAAIISAIESRL